MDVAPLQSLQIKLMQILELLSQVCFKAPKDVHSVIDNAGGVSASSSRYHTSDRGFGPKIGAGIKAA